MLKTISHHHHRVRVRVCVYFRVFVYWTCGLNSLPLLCSRRAYCWFRSSTKISLPVQGLCTCFVFIYRFKEKKKKKWGGTDCTTKSAQVRWFVSFWSRIAFIFQGLEIIVICCCCFVCALTFKFEWTRFFLPSFLFIFAFFFPFDSVGQSQQLVFLLHTA